MSTDQIRILTVEDNPALSGVIRFNLEKAGFHVTCACNGTQAWRLLNAEEFDFLVTDHQMPEMTGSELCEQMRENRQFRDLPIIMLTAKGLELELSKLREKLGVMDVIPKPFSPSELVQKIKHHFADHSPDN